jgi:hypothetical protein
MLGDSPDNLQPAATAASPETKFRCLPRYTAGRGFDLICNQTNQAMANAVVEDNHLKYGSPSYFRANAEEVQLGSIGEKRSPDRGSQLL